MMEWYFGQEAGDLVVPKEQEYFDRLPSPDSWSQWGACGAGDSGWPNNFDAGKISNLPDEKSQQQSLFGRGCKEIDQPEEVERSYGSSNFAGSSEDSHSRNSAASGRPDYSFNNLMGTDATDDIFLSSLLQDDVPVAGHSQGPFSFSPQYRFNMISSDSDSANKTLNCQSVPRDAEGVGSMDCFRDAPSSPADGSDCGHTSFCNLSYENYSDQSNGPSQSIKNRDMLSFDQDTTMRSDEEDSSVEESVLTGLETVLSQLSNKTRLCLRDSLYRLAQHSKDQMSRKNILEDHPLDKFALLDDVDGDSRSGKTEAAELKTNTIDRAVANLMYTKVDANVQDLLPAMAVKFEHAGKNFAAAGSCSNYSLNKADGFLGSKPSDLLAQSEVPVFGQENFSAMQN